MKDHTYINDLRFSSSIQRHIDNLRSRIDNNKASLVIIDGQIGEGKTTLAVEVADYFQGSNINFNRQLGLGADEFRKKLKTCIDHNYPVVIYDEAGDYDKIGFMGKVNRELNRIFDIFRTFKILVIIVLPSFHVLDTRLFDKGIPRLLLHTSKRNNKYGKVSIYGLWRMHYLKFNMCKKNNAVPQQQYLFTKPNERGYFLNLDPERSKLLDEFSTKGKENILKGQIANKQGLITQTEIGDRLGYSANWISTNLKKLDIDPFDKIGQQLYYKKEVIEQLKKVSESKAPTGRPKGTPIITK